MQTQRQAVQAGTTCPTIAHLEHDSIPMPLLPLPPAAVLVATVACSWRRASTDAFSCQAACQFSSVNVLPPANSSSAPCPARAPASAAAVALSPHLPRACPSPCSHPASRPQSRSRRCRCNAPCLQYACGRRSSKQCEATDSCGQLAAEEAPPARMQQSTPTRLPITLTLPALSQPPTQCIALRPHL